MSESPERGIAPEEIRSYLDALEVRMADVRKSTRVMRWTGMVLVFVSAPLVLYESERGLGIDWWIALGPMVTLGVLASWLGRRIGRRLADKEFGPHEELLKKLIAEAEKRRTESEEQSR